MRSFGFLLTVPVFLLLAESATLAQRQSAEMLSLHTAPASDNLPTAAMPRHEAVAVTIGMEQQIFSSYILATAAMKEPDGPHTLGEGDGHVTVFVTNPYADTPVRVEVGATPFSQPSRLEGVLSEALREYQLVPHITWDYEKLRRLQQPTPVDFTVTTWLNDQKISQRTVVATLRSVNDCPYFWEDRANPKGNVDLNYMYTAYINEDDPVIDEVLHQALGTGIVPAFDGVQSGNPKEVDEQVFAIWYALQKRGLRYSSISTNSSTGTSPTLFSQRIRTVDQIWNLRQANCADAMILFASVLRSIQIDPVLVLFPDHCFLGYYRDADNKDFVCLETSMVGDVDFSKLPAAARLRASRQNFAMARQKAQRRYRELKPVFDSGKEPLYRFIVVADERKAGVRPIGR